MTGEDKAKAYDAALERARDYYKANKILANCDENDVLEDIFPELVESEDEKIRKDLIGFFRDGAFLYHKNSEIVSWLEKRGESSIHYWTEEEIEPIISDYLRGVEHYGGMIAKLRCLKPKPSPTCSEEDERLRKTTIAFLKDFAKQGYENAVECIDWLKALQQRIGK